MNYMLCAWGTSAAGHFWIAGMIYSGEFTGYNTGVLTLPFAFMQLGATITLIIHSVGASYGIPASWQMVRYEKNKARTIARGEAFHTVHHWWTDGSAIGSPFIVLLNSPMNNWERVLLYVFYFVFGFGQLTMFVYLEMSGPTPDEELRARYVDKETAFRFRWVLLVSGIGGVLQFFMALLHLDANIQKKWALTQNLVGVTAFCIESVPLMANTFITLHIFLNPYYTFEDMEGLATAQIATAMFCIIVQLVVLYIEAREARKRADGLVAEDMDRYNACWKDVSSGAEASATLMRIRKLCAEAKHAAGRAYTNDPTQRLSNLDSSHKRGYSIFHKLLSVAGALNTVVQGLGRRWSEEAGATSTAGFHKAPIKTAKRAIEKVWRSYNGDPACLTDIVRTSIVCSSLEELERVAKTVFCDTLVQVIRVKNRFDPDYDSKTTAGYRDISMNLKLTSKDGEHTEQIFEASPSDPLTPPSLACPAVAHAVLFRKPFPVSALFQSHFRPASFPTAPPPADPPFASTGPDPAAGLLQPQVRQGPCQVCPVPRPPWRLSERGQYTGRMPLSMALLHRAQAASSTTAKSPASRPAMKMACFAGYGIDVSNYCFSHGPTTAPVLGRRLGYVPT